MITFIWSNTFLIYLLLPFSWLYGLISSLIRFSYRFHFRKVHYFPVPIVMIGNLTTGGNGKTPIVIWLVNQLRARGWKVGVVSRGYGGHAKKYPILIDSGVTIEQCGDEPFLIWKRTGVLVSVAPRRFEAVASLLNTQSLDVVIADDGLQHYSLGRDLEWVVINGERRFGNGWWLPVGPMRERASRLKQVQAIIANGGKPRPGEVPMRLIAGKAINFLTGEHRFLTELTPIVAMAGIGDPARFFTTVRESGISPVREVVFRDHQIYKKQMLSTLTTENEQLIMTEKDAVKCFSFARPNWWYLPVKVWLPKWAQHSLLISIEQIIHCYNQKQQPLEGNIKDN